MKKYTYTLLGLFAITPLVSFAALDGVKGFLVAFKGIVNGMIGVVFALGVLFFFWGMTQFILKDSTNEKTRDDGKQKMLWGVIAIFVMASIFGIISFISNSLNIKTSIIPGGGPSGDCVVGSSSDLTPCTGD